MQRLSFNGMIYSYPFFSVSNVFLDRFVSLVTASQLLNYATISFTYIRFHNVRWAISQPSVVH